MMHSTTYYYAQDSQYDVQEHQNQQLHQQQIQSWGAPVAGYSSPPTFNDTPYISRSLNSKYNAHSAHVVQPSYHARYTTETFSDHQHALNCGYVPTQPATYAPQYLPQAPPPPPVEVYIDTSYVQSQQRSQAEYCASSPTLSELSSLSSGPSSSPLPSPHVITPVSPVSTRHSDTTLLHTSSPTSAQGPHYQLHHHARTSLPPMPLPDLDSPVFRSDSPISSSSASTPTIEVEETRMAPSTSSTGPAIGEFAVLTLTGHTIAASDSYKEILSAARSVRKANESGLVDDSRTCEFCGKVCDRPSTLKTHLNSHTGDRPHACTVPGCGRQFTVLSNMYRHAKVCAAQRAREMRRAAAATARR